MLILVQLAAILYLNSGVFIFTLDDPYIHLALAENIFRGHYGVNSSEYSAPSSSIFWPFLITPIAGFGFSAYAVLFINAIAAFGALFVFWRAFTPSESQRRNTTFVFGMLTLFSILAANMVGLIYTGMEHSLQLFLSLLILYGCIWEIEKRNVPIWLVAAIVLAPLIRYECLALALPAIVFLFMRGHVKTASLTAAALLVLIGIFFVFLQTLSLEPFPTSVMAKSEVVASGGTLLSIAKNIVDSLTSDRGMLLCMLVLILLFVAIDKSRDDGVRLFALLFAGSGFMHIVVGDYGWFYRYEIYMVASLTMAVVYLFKDDIYSLRQRMGLLPIAGFTTAISFLLFATNYKALALTPLAANNIYEQQYQMHRFLSEHYNAPVAVNDLGYVAYMNDEYVLDLWGLASVEALKARKNTDQSTWMDELTKKHAVEFIMIYDDWFHNVPKEWVKLGELMLGKPKITPARDRVAFYATNCHTYVDIYAKLEMFVPTLPMGVRFEFWPYSCGGSAGKAE